MRGDYSYEIRELLPGWKLRLLGPGITKGLLELYYTVKKEARREGKLEMEHVIRSELFSEWSLALAEKQAIKSNRSVLEKNAAMFIQGLADRHLPLDDIKEAVENGPSHGSKWDGYQISEEAWELAESLLPEEP